MIEALVDRLKYLRKTNNISQKKLAEEINVSPGNIGDWERGRSKPSIDAIYQLSRFYKISMDWLISGEDFYTTNNANDISHVNESEEEYNTHEFSMRNYEYSKKIGDRILSLRKSLNLSQKDFCKIINLSQSRLSEIEQNKNKPSYETLISIKSKFDISLDELLTNKPLENISTHNKISDSDHELLSKFNKLDKNDQDKILGMIELKLFEKSPISKKVTSSSFHQEETATKELAQAN
ncbi:helix-turn-helix domain-containing protein [Vallitalea guaymasensis]|uniref:helix-turn-helix domain-containing protein n=1 Tax=Vallitalea guaymasensis TaxID=1185412 RepID=UPI000DE24779|nr:helix-turn-helix domain-containing protein [Vallitalea guaymasensis]